MTNTPTRPVRAAAARAARIPLDAPDDALVHDIAQAAAARGLRLVHDGRRVYLTPRVMPGEFPVGRAA